ncbi:ETC complex I subunit [Candidatus Pelagibacter sp.]|nr:ETC complex I subunit [Candidatus Pelagibacter sp.]
MKKAILYIPNKNPMQSGIAKKNNWILEFKTENPTHNPLMGWESSSDTMSEVKLEFSSKDLAINYAKRKKIDFELIEPKKRKIIKKSYANNFLK